MCRIYKSRDLLNVVIPKQLQSIDPEAILICGSQFALGNPANLRCESKADHVGSQTSKLDQKTWNMAKRSIFANDMFHGQMLNDEEVKALIEIWSNSLVLQLLMTNLVGVGIKPYSQSLD